MHNDLMQEQLRRMQEQHKRFAEQARQTMQAQQDQLREFMRNSQLRAAASRSASPAPPPAVRRVPQPPPVQAVAQTRATPSAQLPLSARPLALTATVLAVSAPIALFVALTLFTGLPARTWFVIFTSVPTFIALIYSTLKRSRLLAQGTASAAPPQPASVSSVAAAAPAPARTVKLTAQQALAWAKQLYTQGNYATCGRVLDRLLLERSVRSQALYFLGLVNFAQQRMVAAAGCFLQASVENPRDANSLYYLGRISQLEGNSLTAAQMYAAAIALSPAHQSALAAIAHI
jgi:TolA-binding protein